MAFAVGYIATQVSAWVSGAVYSGLTAIGVSANAAVVASGYAASLATVGVYATAYLAPALLAPRPEQPGVDSAKEAANQTRAPRRWGMGGSQRLSGPRLLFATIRGYALDVVYHCEGPVQEIGTTWLHDDEVTLGSGGVVQALSDGAYGKNKVSIHSKLGLAGQTAIDELVAIAGDLWTSAHKATGCAITGWISRKCDDGDLLKIYSRGRPRASRLVTFAIYDFRKDSTVPGGVGSQRRDQPGTWTACSNPVICFIHNEIHRWGADWDHRFAPTLEINRASADYCDELVSKYDGGTEARYSINGSYVSSDDRAAVRRWFLECMDGALYRRLDGAIEVRAGRYVEPTFEIPARHIVSLRKTTGTQRSGRINVLTGSFTSPAHAWTQQQAAAFRDEDHIAVAGEQADSLDLPLCASHDLWRRLAYRRWLRRRIGEQMTVTTNLFGLNWAGEPYLTLPPIPGAPPSMSAPTEWEVLGVRKQFPLRVVFTLLKSTGPAIDAPLTGDLAQPGPGVPPRPDRIDVPAPAIDGVEVLPVGGAVVLEVSIAPDYPTGLAGNRFLLRWRSTDGSPAPEEGWSQGSAHLAPDAATELHLQSSVLVPGEYELQAAAFASGVQSDWSDMVTVDASEPAPAVSPPSALSAIGGAGKVTVTYRDPVSPVAYCITRINTSATLTGATAEAPRPPAGTYTVQTFDIAGLSAGSRWVWVTAYDEDDTPSVTVGPVGPVAVS